MLDLCPERLWLHGPEAHDVREGSGDPKQVFAPRKLREVVPYGRQSRDRAFDAPPEKKSVLLPRNRVFVLLELFHCFLLAYLSAGERAAPC